MPLTARQLNRATLDRQLLLRRASLEVTDAIRRITALQAQEAASPYLALWNRLAGFDPADLDAAFAARTIVKATAPEDESLRRLALRNLEAFGPATAPDFAQFTLLVDGHVAGVWRPVDGGIEATAFHHLDDETWHGLAGEAASLLAFLSGRDPAVHRRYAHWWAKDLPSTEVRVLPG